ncbi:hypothetical protein AWB67_05293 [Caballeronia terrestris]|uniref:Uncharacterized protein n=1 Tax=Caballeronia terrestris TaxID=1226301 RepID=A0A158KBQ9_9BURK|nr:hypothetical protein [Caballeronia terrestris]SAL78588.1 hypothetical protein AWB67_05293 [Caballeronia terrestris]
MTSPFLVCEFGKSTLSNLVKECFGSDFPDIFKKKQVDYIFRYLSDLNANSVLLEFEYVDKDYLEDYSRYYVKRFSSIGHKCARLHFFYWELDHRRIDDLLAEGDSESLTSLQQGYLGFMIVKPLPRTFIGKTCLRHYDSINENAAKKALTRRYQVNLFGIDLYIDSIAFQEQDKVVSACATTSIWSALNALAWRPIRSIPSCSEITTNAINFIEGSSNSFPNKELSNKQILRALDVEGLRHHTESLHRVRQDELFETVKCYIDSGLPLILGADVFGVSDDNTLTLKAGHAVSILGYKIGVAEQALYVHDDRLGPFARARIAALSDFACPAGVTHEWGLVLQEKDDEGKWKQPHEVLVPNFLISATHQKVRLPPSYALNTCNTIVDVYEKEVVRLGLESGSRDFSALQNQLSYEVRLTEISDFKRSLMGFKPERVFVDTDGNEINVSAGELAERQAEKLRFLTGSYARFQWIADFRYKARPAFTILIDATDIPQGHAVSAVLIRNKIEADAILELLKYAASPKALQAIEAVSQSFFSSFLRRLRPSDDGVLDHLNRTYGEPRAPRYLKESEIRDGQILNNGSAERFYESIDESLEAKFPQISLDDENSYLIWTIDRNGTLLIGEEIDKMGHPCLTGFKPARIAGELKRTSSGWIINSKSGRYSGDYTNTAELLQNALRRFQSIFHASRDHLSIEPRR